MIKNNKTALMTATDLLAQQEQSSTALRRKLLARKYDTNEIDAAIEKLKRYNYLDDKESCRRQFENLYVEKKLSIRQIIYKLIQRGFDKNFIEGLIPTNVMEYELSVAEKLLAKKFSSLDKFNRTKAWQFLTSRGFDGEIISTVITKFTQS